MCRRFPGVLPSQILAEDAELLRLLEIEELAASMGPDGQW